MTITALPTPPSRLDSVNFSERADAFLGALPQFVNEANSLEALTQYNALVGSCTNTLSIATGTKTISTQTNKAWVAGMYVYLIYPTDYTQTMTGTVSSYNASSGALIVNVTQVTGSGSYSNWNIVTVNPPQSAANVSGGSAGQILYQTAANTTGFMHPANANAIATATGTPNAITATYTPAIAALTDGMTLYAWTTTTNTTVNPTFTPASGTIAAKTIVKGAGMALEVGDIGGWAEFQYSASLDKWVLQNPVNGVSPKRGSANRIINGSMAVDQRNNGASLSSGVGAQTYSVDRWWFVGIGAAVTGQRVSGSSFGYQYAFQITGAAGNTYAAYVQRIESLNAFDLASTTVTVSFSVSSSTLTSIQAVLSYAGATDNWTSPTVISTNTISINNTATRYTFSVALPANVVNGLELRFVAPSGITSGTLTITGVQLEAGSVATPFERRPYGTELALCQRYFYQPTAAGSLSQLAQQYGSVAGSNLYRSIYFPVPMRVTPTVVAAWTNGTNATPSTILADGTASSTARLMASAPGEFAATINWTSFSAEI